ncbi:hypothetical protein SCLCIDRAFT_243003 [Scleroderma citrinum Foug A]|uniref:Uncharacterized protein n=1 Tax=Scleroderma citrinum Foug A TaxID=1036808 RepID=A0A0C3DJT6_9AGAM|nr:hypothetical protein SCLCIDRAFT_243003 [Scleroderma citrinum Foug A]
MNTSTLSTLCNTSSFPSPSRFGQLGFVRDRKCTLHFLTSRTHASHTKQLIYEFWGHLYIHVGLWPTWGSLKSHAPLYIFVTAAVIRVPSKQQQSPIRHRAGIDLSRDIPHCMTEFGHE